MSIVGCGCRRSSNMPKVVVPVKEEILRAAERRKAVGGSEGVVELLAELIDLGEVTWRQASSNNPMVPLRRSPT